MPSGASFIFRQHDSRLLARRLAAVLSGVARSCSSTGGSRSALASST